MPGSDEASGSASADLCRRPGGAASGCACPAARIRRSRHQPAGRDIRRAVPRKGTVEGDRTAVFPASRIFQSKTTKPAARHLKQLSGRTRRIRKDCDDVPARKIVASAATDSRIAVENLTEIRTRTRQRGRRRRHAWIYAQLRGFPRRSGRNDRCHRRCRRSAAAGATRFGHVHRRNRPTQSTFRCRRADTKLNATRSVAWKYLAGGRMSAAGGPPVSRPILGEHARISLLTSHRLPAAVKKGRRTYPTISIPITTTHPLTGCPTGEFDRTLRSPGLADAPRPRGTRCLRRFPACGSGRPADRSPRRC